MARVYVAIPSLYEIRAELYPALRKIENDDRHTTFVDIRFGKPIDDNRNRALEDFWRYRCDYLLMMDDDNPPAYNPLDFVNKYSYINFPTPAWLRNGLVWNVFYHTGSHYEPYPMDYEPTQEIEHVDAVSTGCFLVHKDVLRKIKQPVFERPLDQQGLVEKSSDLYFSEKLWAANQPVNVAWNYPCRHIKQVDLLELRKQFYEQTQDQTQWISFDCDK